MLSDHNNQKRKGFKKIIFDLKFIFFLGILIRLVVMPITSKGNDFVVWDLYSDALLQGKNFYLEHPVGLPGGPFAYFPLFLYILLPFKLLSNLTSFSFTFLGKVPILLADVGISWLIYDYLKKQGYSYKKLILGASLFLFNPLIIYNSCFYGRFDSVCIFLLLLAFRSLDKFKGYIYYGLAIATKIFPIFLAPYLFFKYRNRRTALFLSLAIPFIISAPYLIESPPALLKDVLLYNSFKYPGHFSWQIIFYYFSLGSLGLFIATLIILIIGMLLILLSGKVLSKFSSYTYSIFVFSLFILSMKSIHEQYFTWLIPFLGIQIVRKDNLAILVYSFLTLIGLVDNDFVKILNFNLLTSINLVLACILVYYIIHLMIQRTILKKSLNLGGDFGKNN